MITWMSASIDENIVSYWLDIYPFYKVIQNITVTEYHLTDIIV